MVSEGLKKNNSETSLEQALREWAELMQECDDLDKVSLQVSSTKQSVQADLFPELTDKL